MLPARRTHGVCPNPARVGRSQTDTSLTPFQPPRALTGRSRAWTLALALLLLLTACAKDPAPSPTPSTSQSSPVNGPVADATVALLTKALMAGKLDGVPFIGDSSAATTAKTDYSTIMSGMDGLTPSVTAGPIRYSQDLAEVDLTQTYTFESKKWSFTSLAKLNLSNGTWFVDWDPRIVHPDVDERTRLRHSREPATRASIVGAKGLALMEARDLYRVGIDKTRATAAQWPGSAKALATLLGVDPKAFTDRVLKAGPQAFVVATTMRQTDIPAGMTAIPGAYVQATTGVVGPNRMFARSILGVVGEATAEQTKASKGLIQPGDLVGMSGLQKRYDAQLRGSASHTIDLVVRKGASAAPSDQPSGATQLFVQEAVPGKPLQVSLDLESQMKAEQVLAGVAPIASIVVVRPATGEIVAAANSPAAGENPDATFGRYAPGSTFKVVTALALLRKGWTAGTPVQCTATATVHGRVFKNYTDFPADRIGTMSLQDALATSCNTAFLNLSTKLDPQDLAEAAASLGVGMDYDAGYSSFFGSVPPPPDLTTKAANLIGQGQVEASPMAMAAVMASVAAGKTTIPWLVAATKPVSKAKPLSSSEASQLQQMTRAVVSSGSGRALQGQMLGGKTGTAEFGTAKPPKTHAWMIAWKGDLAVAVMVAEGESGSKTALPIIQAYLKP